MLHEPHNPTVQAEGRYTVPALDKGLRTLLLFGQCRGELSFSEVCRRMSMPKASTFRTLQTLERMGFLRRDETSGGYSLGISVLRLGFDYLSSMDLVQMGQPILHRLRDATGFSSHICVLDDRDVVYVARASAAGEIGGVVGVGSRLPAHCTAIGRVLLMTRPRHQLQALFPEPAFTCLSEQGPSTPDELFRMLEADRQRGHTISESFYQPGICAVAYPVRDRAENVVAAVSVMVPRHSLPQDMKDSLVEAVSQAAADIERFLQASC